MSTARRITLTQTEDWWVAKDERTGVASQGQTREKALEMLDEAVALHKGEAGRPVTDEELGIDPDEIPEIPEPLPDFMR